MRPDKPLAYFNLGNTLSRSGHWAEAARRYLEAKERFPVGSERWAVATAAAFDTLRQEACAEVAKPKWWHDKGLKAMSTRVVRAAPNDVAANSMRAFVLSGRGGAAWEGGLRSVAEFKEAIIYFERAAALTDVPARKAKYAEYAEQAAM